MPGKLIIKSLTSVSSEITSTPEQVSPSLLSNASSSPSQPTNHVCDRRGLSVGDHYVLVNEQGKILRGQLISLVKVSYGQNDYVGKCRQISTTLSTVKYEY